MYRLLMALGVCLALTTPTWAQSPTPTQTSASASQALSPQDQDELRRAAEVINQLLDDKNIGGKTSADVLDKALDMFGGYITIIAQKLEQVAPHVYRIFVRQQYAKAIPPLLCCLVAIIVLLILNATAFKRMRNDNRDEDNVAIGYIAPVVILFVILIVMSEFLPLLINPEYYAIRDIVRLVLNKGQGL